MVTSLSDTAYTVHSTPGAHYRGYRLQPGVQIDPDALLRAAHLLGHDGEPVDVMPLLATHAHQDERITEALSALSLSSSVMRAARAVGVSQRSMTRIVRQGTNRPPVYWHRLARLRRAAQALHSTTPLSVLAADHGFSDQAHLNRECLHWFGLTPGACRRTPSVLAMLLASGYGTAGC